MICQRQGSFGSKTQFGNRQRHLLASTHDMEAARTIRASIPSFLLLLYCAGIGNRVDRSHGNGRFRNAGSPGRLRTTVDIEQLIVRIAIENPSWGYTRIHGAELNIGRGTIRRILKEHLGRYCLPILPELPITETIDEMIVYHSNGRHVGIHDRRTDETESATLKVLAEYIGFDRSCRDLSHDLPPVKLGQLLRALQLVLKTDFARLTHHASERDASKVRR